ncbi:HSP20 family protein [Saccharopolyspora erythraea NRRL 2338]|uniref:Heat shock protein HSP20 n=2 Tax=Saccharopolyspora erythraea TaxID=1836 RepID=A4F628_SACEN|nr:Hsp20/alpha crystallin family protein [Saccharopolyspora erythraea]EQD88005.1 heat shock protein Hsp20 [Saccharopolyspora erythraea D]PFG93301.1 HSP20 family protein [Saccharopolyspora erythraea NRRL 2338]QRK90146.1 Hsp20/alpha crystallin family protein [Saccharopolyspora erythraea]CAL99502.1 heat shock protein HSP20 [Saccharopolyspora erythraea NRRL 2338]
MTLVRRSSWDPFGNLVRQMDRDFDSISRRFFGSQGVEGFVPATNVERDGSDVVIKLELPGVDIAQDVEVEVTDGRLSISGQRRTEKTSGEDGAVLLREIRTGAFRREFNLPEGVTAEQVEANYDRGVLEVRVHEVSKPAPAPTKIQIADRRQGDGKAELN